MNSFPICSIVIPAFNAEAYISEAIQSVLAQSVSNWELIVIDDGSRDGTIQTISEFKDLRIRVVQQENAGAGAARNRGIEESCGRIICFLDADDRLCPDALKRLVVALEANPHACLAYGEPIVMDASGQVLVRKRVRSSLGGPPAGCFDISWRKTSLLPQAGLPSVLIA